MTRSKDRFQYEFRTSVGKWVGQWCPLLYIRLQFTCKRWRVI